MKIVLNGISLDTNQVTLAGLLEEQGYKDLMIATAVEQSFVSKDQRVNTRLYEGCHIDIVAPMQGG